MLEPGTQEIPNRPGSESLLASASHWFQNEKAIDGSEYDGDKNIRYE